VPWHICTQFTRALKLTKITCEKLEKIEVFGKYGIIDQLFIRNHRISRLRANFLWFGMTELKQLVTEFHLYYDGTIHQLMNFCEKLVV
jgi:hypothetical protein